MDQQLAVASAANFLDGKYSIGDVLDLNRLRSLLEKFSQLTGCTVALVSYPDQEILVSAGWRDICTKFHRANPESAAACLQSNVSMTSKATEPGVVVLEPCQHGLADGGVPIIINGVRLATLATGQVFFQPPDLERFKRQAERFGYDTEKYLAAVRQVPVVSEERFRATLSLLGDLAALIAQMGYYGLEMRDKADAMAGKFRLANLPRENPEVVMSIARDGRILYANPAAEALLGHPRIKPVMLAKLCREALSTGLNREIAVEIEGRSYAFLVVPTTDYVSMYGRDIVQQQQAVAADPKPAEDGIGENRQELETLIRSIRDVIWTMTGDAKKFLYLSPAVEEMFGCQQSEFFANANLWSQMIHPEDQAFARDTLAQVFQSGHAEADYRIVRPDGQVRWLRNKISVVFGDDGKPMQIGGIARDVTENKLAQMALQESEQRYRTLFDSMTEGFAIHQIITDETGEPVDYRFLDVNPAFERLTGLSRARVIGHTQRELMPDEDPMWLRKYGQVALTGQPVRFENFSAVLKRHYEVLAYRPAPRQFAVVFTDVTERKLTEASLRESETLLQQAQASAGMGAYSLDIASGMWRSTETLDRIFGIDAGYGRSVEGWAALIHPDDRDMMVEYFSNEVLGRIQPFDKEYRITRQHDRASRWVLGKGRLECDAQGRPRRMYGMIVDITEHKEKELELKRLNRTLKALSDCNAALLEANDETDFLAEVCRIIIEDCGHAMVWIGYMEHDQAKSVRPVAWAGFEEGYVQEAHISWGDNDQGRGPTGTAIRTGREYICRNMQTDPCFAPWRERAAKRGYCCVVAIPLINQGEGLGALSIYSREIDPFSQDEIKLLWEIANALSLGIVTIRARQANVRSQQLLKEHRAKLDAALASMTDAVFISDAKGHLIHFNQAFATFHRFQSRDQCADHLAAWQNMIEAFQANGQPLPLDQWAVPRALRGESASNVEYILRRKDTGETWIGSYSFGPIRDLEDAIVGCVAVGRDITASKQAEKQVRLHLAAIEAAANAIVITAPDGAIQWVNPAFTQLTGYTAAEAVGQNPRVLKSGTHEAAFYKNLWDTITAGQVWHGELVNRRKDGSLYNEEMTITPVSNAAGAIEHFVAIKQDVTERKHIQVALAESEERFRAIFEKAADGIMVTDPTTMKFHSGNTRMCQMLGYAAADIPRLEVQDIHPAEHLLHIVRRFGQQWRGDNAMRKDVPVMRADGSIFYADISGFPLVLNGKTYLVDFFRDVSERKRAEDEARGYQKRLRELALELTLAEERERKRLAGIIHDDLGQVLSAVKMRLSVLRQPCNEVKRDGELKVIDDLVDMAIRSSRSLTGSLSHPALYDLGLIAGVEWLVEDIHRLYGLEVRLITAEKAIPIDLRVRVLLFQCIRELLVNVAKHARAPKAMVRISRVRRMVRVVVKDRGAGFVFKLLPSHSKDAGFGLFSTRERLRHLGGKVNIHSTPGKGTTIMLTVPDAITKEE